MVDTPDDLIGNESIELHYVSHIDPLLRVTTLNYQKDTNFEDAIEYKVNECRKYANHYYKLLVSKNLG